MDFGELDRQRRVAQLRKLHEKLSVPALTRNPLGAFDFAALLLIPIIIRVAVTKSDLFTLYQVQTQDLPVLMMLVPLLLLLQRWAPALRLPSSVPPKRILLAVALVLAALVAWASTPLLWSFPVSRDEHMVAFDMAVYAKGRLAAPMPVEWRPFAEALVPAFLQNDWMPRAVVSDYLPVNAILRLAFAKLADPSLLNPLLALLGGLALFDVARRLFPQDKAAIGVSLLVYTLSAQMLVNAMTAYAMTGHMAFNLIWLSAFLRGGRVGHAVAIVTGGLAVGLHQLVFHPFFAAPFILWRLRQGAWRVAALYGAAYVLIVAWWVTFPMLVAAHTGLRPAVLGPSNSSYIAKVYSVLMDRNPNAVGLMLLNIARFVAWQHLALLPLFIAGAPVAWRERSAFAPMIWGIALWTLFVGLVLPFQGHGWGYRYLHPYLGSFALLAGFGYRRLATLVPREVESAFVALSLVTALGSIPLLLASAHEFVRPRISLDRYIASRPADFVIVDTDAPTPTKDNSWAVNAIDDVRNEPDLQNRPLRFSSRSLTPALVADLCRRGKVAVVDWDDMHRVGFGLNVIGAHKHMDDLMMTLQQGGCLVTARTSSSYATHVSNQ